MLKGQKNSPETIQKIRLKAIGRLHTEKTKKKLSRIHAGKKLTDEHREKISNSLKGKPPANLQEFVRLAKTKTGNKNIMWNGGVSSERRKAWTSTRYREWRLSVFKRDKYCCVLCGDKGRLNADHIKPWAKFPDLRYAVENGRTLCVDCHRKTETYGFKSTKFYESKNYSTAN